MILRCEICFADIGRFDPGRLGAPLDASMFEPLSPGFPRPFPEGAGLMELLCPYCRKRAVGNDRTDPERVHPGRLLTPDGPFEADRRQAEPAAQPRKKGVRAHG